MRAGTTTQERPTIRVKLPVPYALTALVISCSDTMDMADIAGLALVHEMVSMIVGNGTPCRCVAHAVTRQVQQDLVREQIARIHETSPELESQAYQLAAEAQRSTRRAA